MHSFNGHAKINLSLDVLGVRPDGFHEVRTIMQPLALADTVTVSGGRSIEIDCTDARVPLGPTNTVHKVALNIYQRAGISPEEKGASFFINKKLPFAGGLGGSSADVGPALQGLNELLELGYHANTLEEIAGTIGADAAFSVQNKTCLAEGRGEKITRLKSLPPAGIVVVEPNMEYLGSSKTKRAYELFDAPSKQPKPKKTTDQVLRAIRSEDWKEIGNAVGNALEPVIYPRFPQLAKIASTLVRNGCWTAHLAGGGPCVYGLCETASAKKIAKEVGHLSGIANVYATSTLQHDDMALKEKIPA